MAEYYRGYSYSKLFSCSLDEYESRPFKETEWMLQIDRIFHEAQREAEEREANRNR